MDRRLFLSAVGALPVASIVCAANSAPQIEQSDQYTAGSGDGPIFVGSPVVSGPAPEAITILHPISRHATGWLEYAVEDAPFERVDALIAGLMPLESQVLKFRLPPLPAGKAIRYRFKAHSIGWTRVQKFEHGQIVAGEPQSTPDYSFRTLDPNAARATFVVWNDTHENSETLRTLHEQTVAAMPDLLLWNGDQSNDVHFEEAMAGQYLMPEGLAIADRWPLAYVRGNHDLRGPAARLLPRFTGSPNDRFYYGFRSGPVAAIVLDTGEDKPDDDVRLGGLTNFAAMRREQTGWLESTVSEPWFRDAPFRILFCHIPLWWREKDIDAFSKMTSRACRDAWSNILQRAGVRVVISGHTHKCDWLPAAGDQPLGQLIGGGPVAKIATIIYGTATREQLTLTMKKLDGTVVAEVKLDA